MNVLSKTFFTFVLVVATAAMASAQTETTSEEGKSGLVGSVASKLGISEGDAESATAAVMSLAKSQLGDLEFGILSKALPEVDGLLQKTGGLEMSSMADVTKHLEGLGIEGGAIKSFAPAILDYVQETAGSGKAKLLRKAMSLRSGS